MEIYPFLRIWQGRSAAIPVVRLHAHLRDGVFVTLEEYRAFVTASLELFCIYFPEYRLVFRHNKYDLYRKDIHVLSVSIGFRSNYGEIDELPF